MNHPFPHYRTRIAVRRMKHLQVPATLVVGILVLSTSLPTMLAFGSSMRWAAWPNVRSRSSSNPFLKVCSHHIVTTLALQQMSSSALATSTDPAGADEQVGCLQYTA